MQEEQPKRKPRTPLSAEELFYVKEIKKLKELRRIADFKATKFYKVLNRANIVFAGFLSYCVLSVLICCYWESNIISKVNCTYGKYNPTYNKRTIDEINITTISGDYVNIKTDDLFQVPQVNESFYIGRDLIFGKVIKAKLHFDDRAFWQINTYPAFTVTIFALCMGFFVYKVNKHLSINGLLTVFGLFALASLYFILI
jgi:hypothetical protein